MVAQIFRRRDTLQHIFSWRKKSGKLYMLAILCSFWVAAQIFHAADIVLGGTDFPGHGLTKNILYDCFFVIAALVDPLSASFLAPPISCTPLSAGGQPSGTAWTPLLLVASHQLDTSQLPEGGPKKIGSLCAHCKVKIIKGRCSQTPVNAHCTLHNNNGNSSRGRAVAATPYHKHQQQGRRHRMVPPSL